MTAIWTVYLSGEIHSDWRERIAAGIKTAGLPIELVSPVTALIIGMPVGFVGALESKEALITHAGDIPYITLHPAEHDHALKEVDGAAHGVAREPEQVVAALAYVIRGEMPQTLVAENAAE